MKSIKCVFATSRPEGFDGLSFEKKIPSYIAPSFRASLRLLCHLVWRFLEIIEITLVIPPRLTEGRRLPELPQGASSRPLGWKTAWVATFTPSRSSQGFILSLFCPPNPQTTHTHTRRLAPGVAWRLAATGATSPCRHNPRTSSELDLKKVKRQGRPHGRGCSINDRKWSYVWRRKKVRS